MDAKFTIPYSEYAVAERINDAIKKKGISIYIPASRQEKGSDFLLINTSSRKAKLFQVKSSRSYESKSHKIVGDSTLTNLLWIDNFFQVSLDKNINKLREKEGLADWYVMYGLCPILSEISTRIDAKWLPMILCFKEQEVKDLIEKSEDKAIYIRFKIKDGKFEEIVGDRAFKKVSLKKYLLDNRINEIIADLQ